MSTRQALQRAAVFHEQEWRDEPCSLTWTEPFKASREDRPSCNCAETFLSNKALGILEAVTSKDACTKDYDQAWPESIGKKSLSLEACVYRKKPSPAAKSGEFGKRSNSHDDPTMMSKKSYDEHALATIIQGLLGILDAITAAFIRLCVCARRVGPCAACQV